MKIEELRDRFESEKIGGFISREHADYLSNTNVAFCTIVTREKNILLTNRMNYLKAKEESNIEDIRTYSKKKVPIREGEENHYGDFGEVLSDILEELQNKRFGFDNLKKKTRKKVENNTDKELKNKSELLWELRKKKTTKEIKNIKKAGKLAREGLKRAEKILDSNLTEKELAAEIEYEMRKKGSEGTPFDTIVATGENSKHPHGLPKNKIVNEEDLITIDLGARWNGYCSDMTRTFCLNPNDEKKKIMDLVKKAQEKCLQKVEEGISTKKIDETARDVFREENLEKFYIHGTGHGLGLDIHEPPSLSLSSEEELEENMVVTVEPGIYIDGIGGCRFEDTIVVKKDGYEKLT